MSATARTASLAMLDEFGVVVSFYGRTDGNDRLSEYVVDRHVSQFYRTEDIETQQPLRDLHDAVIDGTCTRKGWRIRRCGAVWSTTVIQAVLLRDGRVQGFSYVTHETEGPSEHMPNAQSLDRLPEHGTIDSEAPIRPAFIAARHRMSQVNSFARQRRLAARGTRH